MYILVLSRSQELYSTRSLVNAAKRKGHLVSVVDHTECDLMIQKGRLRIFYHNQELQGVNAIIPRIGNSATSTGAALITQFESMGIFTTLKSSSLLRSRSKVNCLQELAANGVNVPDTLVLHNNYTIDKLLEKWPNYPKIVKLVSGTHGLGVIKADDAKMTEALIETFNKLRHKVLVQEFIEEADGADLRVFIVDGKIEGVMERKAKEGEFRSNLHRGATARVVTLTEEEARVARKAVKIMELDVAGVDILRSHRGPMVLEVNASPGLEGIETTTGNDIAGKIISFVERNAKPSWRK